jgi:hypothetical protein
MIEQRRKRLATRRKLTELKASIFTIHLYSKTPIS